MANRSTRKYISEAENLPPVVLSTGTNNYLEDPNKYYHHIDATVANLINRGHQVHIIVPHSAIHNNPQNNGPSKVATAIAQKYNLPTYNFEPGKDGVHPRDPRFLANQIDQRTNGQAKNAIFVGDSIAKGVGDAAKADTSLTRVGAPAQRVLSSIGGPPPGYNNPMLNTVSNSTSQQGQSNPASKTQAQQQYSGQGQSKRNTLAANQQAAYDALRQEGFSDSAAKIFVANFSGESLARPNDHHWDVKHMSQGIVQWDPGRARAIEKQFGALPKDMSVADQAKAYAWELKTQYPGVYNHLHDERIPASQRMYNLVKTYERPRDSVGSTNARLGYLKNLNVSDDPQQRALAAGALAGAAGAGLGAAAGQKSSAVPPMSKATQDQINNHRSSLGLKPLSAADLEAMHQELHAPKTAPTTSISAKAGEAFGSVPSLSKATQDQINNHRSSLGLKPLSAADLEAMHQELHAPKVAPAIPATAAAAASGAKTSTNNASDAIDAKMRAALNPDQKKDYTSAADRQRAGIGPDPKLNNNPNTSVKGDIPVKSVGDKLKDIGAQASTGLGSIIDTAKKKYDTDMKPIIGGAIADTEKNFNTNIAPRISNAQDAAKKLLSPRGANPATPPAAVAPIPVIPTAPKKDDVLTQPKGKISDEPSMFGPQGKIGPDAAKLPGGLDGLKDRDVRAANMQNTSNNIEKQQSIDPKDVIDPSKAYASINPPQAAAKASSNATANSTSTQLPKPNVALDVPSINPNINPPKISSEKPSPMNYNGFEPGDPKDAEHYRNSSADVQGSIRDKWLNLKPGTSMNQTGITPLGYIAPEPDPKAAAKARADHNDRLDAYVGNKPGTTNAALDAAEKPDPVPEKPKISAPLEAPWAPRPTITPGKLAQQIQPNATDLAQPDPELNRIKSLAGVPPKPPEPPKSPTPPKPPEAPKEPEKAPEPKSTTTSPSEPTTTAFTPSATPAKLPKDDEEDKPKDDEEDKPKDNENDESLDHLLREYNNKLMKEVPLYQEYNLRR